jgi:hypothetical protein
MIVLHGGYHHVLPWFEWLSSAFSPDHQYFHQFLRLFLVNTIVLVTMVVPFITVLLVSMVFFFNTILLVTMVIPFNTVLLVTMIIPAFIATR